MGKFFNEHSARCTRCGTYLKSLGLARNENHLYPIGTLYGCRCRASKVWTNSIRNEAALLAHYETGSRYYQGFCNDLFDGEGREIVLWRSVDFPGEQQRGQVYGTKATIASKKDRDRTPRSSSGLIGSRPRSRARKSCAPSTRSTPKRSSGWFLCDPIPKSGRFITTL